MSNHRADSRASRRETVSGPRPQGGRRRAEKPPAPRQLPGGPLPSRLPMIPTLTGAVAVTIAAGGTVAAGTGQAGFVTTGGRQAGPQSGAITSRSGPGESQDGTDAIGDRGRTLSRSADRQTAVQTRARAGARPLAGAVERQAALRNAALTSLARSAQRQAGVLKQNLWHLPTEGYHLTARFGSSGGLWSHFHTGLDFAAPTGTPIFAVASGTITDTGYDGSYGNKTVETLEDGTQIWYAHQSAVDVHVGEPVTGGETIGAVGSTGNTTGPHVHIEVRPGGGDPVDPYTAMVYHGLHP